MLSQSDNAPLNSTGVNVERKGLLSPIKCMENESVDDEKWIASFLDVMGEDESDESE